MDKRLLTAVIVSIILIFAYNTFYIEKYQKKNAVNIELSNDGDSNVITSSGDNKSEVKSIIAGDTQGNIISATLNSISNSAATIPDTLIITKRSELKYYLKNNNKIIEFTNHGAAIKSIKLLTYKNLITGDTLDLIDSSTEILSSKPLSIDLDMNGELSNVIFNTLDYSDTFIIFEYQTLGKYYSGNNILKSSLPAGLRIQKRFDLTADNYILKMNIKIIKPAELALPELRNITIKNPEGDPFSGGLCINWSSGLVNENKAQNSFMYLTGESFKKELPGSGAVIKNQAGIPDSREIHNNIIRISESKWIALSTNYFLSALTLDSVKSNIAVIYSDKLNVGYTYLSAPLLFADNIIDLNYKLFIGPKDYTSLKKLFPNFKLEETMEYGWFHALALILLKVLKFFYSLIPNYGVAIILLTILINVILYPLKVKSLRSMEDMKKMQPKIEELKQKSSRKL